jgi:hypothetical protein
MDMRRTTVALALTMLMLASTLATAPVSASDGEDRWGSFLSTGDDSTYLVVAPEGWQGFLKPLMDWRDRTSGHTSHFLSIEDALANGLGRDNPAKLRSSIREAEPSAVLLVGDSEVLPVRRVFTDILLNGNESDPLNYRWTDDYYVVGTESDWDRDGDGVYGEDDEVFEEIADAFAGSAATLVGRVPASSELEVERFVDKLLAYERTPPPGDWYTSALLVSGLMDVPNHLDNPFTPDLDGGYELFSDNSYESHTKLMDIIPDRFSRTWVYDYPRLDGGSWNRSVDIMDHDSVVSAFDEGHSMVAMNGHGWVDGSGLAHYNGSGYSNYWWDWHDAYTYADADNATNGGRLPWVYVAACYVGDVTVAGDRSLERLVMNPDGGAIGLVAGNGENYKGESIANDSYGNWFLERHFWQYYLEHGPGRAMLETKRDYLALVSSDDIPHKPLYDAYYVADYLSPNLLGDPLTMVWTDVPGTLRVSDLHDDEVSGDWLQLTVVDGDDEPVPGATVHIRWDGNSTTERTDYGGNASLRVPLDAGTLEVVVSARNHIPASAEVERPINQPDLSTSRVRWLVDGIEGVPAKIGDAVTLMADIGVVGRYDFDQARVRFSVAPENGDFERLVPDVFTAVWTGESPVAETTWTPPWPGKWHVRAEVNPADELPDRTVANNIDEALLAVQGQPRWETLPSSISLSCGDAPGTSYDLLVHVSDPDTPREDLAVTAQAVGEVPEGVTFTVDDEGRLLVCSRFSRASLELDLEVTDGTFTDTARLTVDLTRTAPRLMLSGENFITLEQGDNVTGELTMVNLGPGPVEDDLVIVDLSGNVLFDITPEGAYTFEGLSPGTYQVRVGIQRPDGSSEAPWQDTILSFRVRPEAGWSPQPYGWPELEIAEGDEVKVHLQAVDLEGGPVIYELVDADGLRANLDPETGMLTLKPGEGDAGRHELVISLSDGTNEEDYILQAFVTEESSTGTAFWVVVGLAGAATFGGAVYWFVRSRDEEDDSS